MFPIPVTAFSQQDLLDMLTRVLPPGYLLALQNPGPGYELPQSFAKILARASQSAATTGQDAQFLTANAGGFATGTVQLSRPTPLASGSPLPGKFGSTASIVTGASAGNMRVTGLTAMTSADAAAGIYLDVSGAASPTNNGSFPVAAFVDAATLDVVNAAAVIPDANNGTISWVEETRIVTVKTGTVVTTSQTGKDFVTLADVIFQQADVGPFTVGVQAVAQGYEYNVKGPVTTANGTVIPGEIDTVKVPNENPVLGDLTITVAQLTDTIGGMDDALSALGLDRGLPRRPGEGTAAYRARVRALPDTISPDAIVRNCTTLLSQFGITFQVIEPGSIAYQTCWDAVDSIVVPGTGYSPTTFTYDNPPNWTPNFPYLTGNKIFNYGNIYTCTTAGTSAPVVGPTGEGTTIHDGSVVWSFVSTITTFNGRWLDENDFRGAVIVVLSNNVPLKSQTSIWDDIAGAAPSTRGVGAWDTPANFTAGIIGVWDGFSVLQNAIYRGLYDLLQQVKAAGVSVRLELSGQ